jgi:sialic acid synthase SpsE
MGRLIDAAQAAGASAIKVQAYTVDELCQLRGEGPAPAPWNHLSMRELYALAQTPLDWLPYIARHCERIGMPWGSSIFGKESLEAVMAVQPDFLKIASFERHQEVLVKSVLATGKPMLISVRDWQWQEERRDWYDDDEEQIGRLYCAEGYPCPPERQELPHFEYDDGWVNYLGLSSHCLAPELPIAAVARGAKLLEYHVQLDDERSELESEISLTMTQFADMVKAVKRTELMLA